MIYLIHRNIHRHSHFHTFLVALSRTVSVNKLFISKQSNSLRQLDNSVVTIQAQASSMAFNFQFFSSLNSRSTYWIGSVNFALPLDEVELNILVVITYNLMLFYICHKSIQNVGTYSKKKKYIQNGKLTGMEGSWIHTICTR